MTKLIPIPLMLMVLAGCSAPTPVIIYVEVTSTPEPTEVIIDTPTSEPTTIPSYKAEIDIQKDDICWIMPERDESDMIPLPEMETVTYTVNGSSIGGREFDVNPGDVIRVGITREIITKGWDTCGEVTCSIYVEGNLISFGGITPKREVVRIGEEADYNKNVVVLVCQAVVPDW